MPSVAILIVTHNSQQYLEPLFASLRRHTQLDRIPIIVVDNASTDGTLGILKRLSRELRTLEILPQSRNLGFAAGNNIGLARLRKLGVHYAQLINPDTEVTAGWLNE